MFWFFAWMYTVAVLACSSNNSQLRVCTVRQMSGGTSVPARKNLRCRVPQGCIPTFHFGSFHLLALLACIHLHLFTNISFCSCFGGLSGVMSTILHFAIWVSTYRLDWGYVLSYHWIGLSTMQQYFIQALPSQGVKFTDLFIRSHTVLITH
jgi:hypothetical protein